MLIILIAYLCDGLLVYVKISSSQHIQVTHGKVGTGRECG